MSIKFSVGMSEAEEDRLRLEQGRQSPRGMVACSERDLSARPPGWPVAPEGSDDERELEPAALPLWAW